MLNFDNISVDYEPYPVLFARDLLPKAVYDELADTFPAVNLQSHRASLGNKFILTEFDGDSYYNVIQSNPAWTQFYRYIKSEQFIKQMIDLLKSKNIDLGLDDVEVVNDNKLVNPVKRQASRVKRKLKSLKHITSNSPGHLTSRFEFSILPPNGGSHRPHTDTPRKVIALVLSFMKQGEWQENWGGGTAVCKPKDLTKSFNYVNNYVEFDEVDIVKTFPLIPGGCVIFIKTFNSWHCVEPIHATREDAYRKTIVINIDHVR